MADKLNITRRDFLNGVALSLAAGTSLSPLELLAQGRASKPYYPPEFGPANGPHIKGRAQFGRISIANSDSSAYAYVDGAIDAAVRAVKEQTSL